MSGLANVVFPDLANPDRAMAGLLLAGFDIIKNPTPYAHLGRFRGSWFEKDEKGLVCAFYTRNGGGNRECYCEDICACQAGVMKALPEMETYIRDEDDSFDSTYATIYFRARRREGLEELYNAILAETTDEKVDMSQWWQDVISALGDQS